MGRFHIARTSEVKHESEGSCTQLPKKSLAQALRSTTTICQVFVFAEEVEGGTPSFLKSPLQVAYELQLFRKNTSFSGFPGSKMLPSAVCSVAGTESSLRPSPADALLRCHVPGSGQGRGGLERDNSYPAHRCCKDLREVRSSSINHRK